MSDVHQNVFIAAVALTLVVGAAFGYGYAEASPEPQQDSSEQATVDCYVSAGNVTMIICHSGPGVTVRYHDFENATDTTNGSVSIEGDGLVARDP